MKDYDSYLIEHYAGRMNKRRAFLHYLFDKITSLFIPKETSKIKDPRKILIIRNDHIGDVILSTSIFREIKKTYPNSKITALVSEKTKGLIEKDKNINEIITFGIFSEVLKAKKFSFFREYWETFKKIKKGEYAVGVDLRCSSVNMILLLWLPRVKARVGYYNVTGGKSFLTHPILLRGAKKHAVEITFDLIRKGLDVKTKDSMPKIVTDKEDELIVNNFLRKNKIKKFICICPAATVDWKTWSAEKFEELIIKISKDYPKYKILLPGGKKDSDLINRLSVTKNCIPLINFDLRRQSLIFKKSELVVSNDGGLLHMAWVSGARVIALFGPRAALHSVPPLKNATVVIDKSYKIENIPVSRVEKEIKKILKK